MVLLVVEYVALVGAHALLQQFQNVAYFNL